MDFKCRQCGECCRRLFNEIRIKGTTIVSGMQIQLSELPMMRSLGVKCVPQLACGMKGKRRRRPVTIYTYQVAANICPLLKDNKCSIHDRKPLSCRTYPIQDGYIVDTRCPVIKENTLFLDAKGGVLKEPMDLKDAEIAYWGLEHEWEKVKGGEEWPMWVYDLKTQRWFIMERREIENIVSENRS